MMPPPIMIVAILRSRMYRSEYTKDHEKNCSMEIICRYRTVRRSTNGTDAPQCDDVGGHTRQKDISQYLCGGRLRQSVKTSRSFRCYNHSRIFQLGFASQAISGVKGRLDVGTMASKTVLLTGASKGKSAPRSDLPSADTPRRIGSGHCRVHPFSVSETQFGCC